MLSLTDAIKGTVRIGQTAMVLSKTGVNWLKGDRPPTARVIRQTFESLGATYIKLGQFIASSPTFFLQILWKNSDIAWIKPRHFLFLL